MSKSAVMKTGGGASGQDVIALQTEVTDARGIKATLGNRLDESLMAGGQLRLNSVGIEQLDDTVSNKLVDINRIHRVPLLQQTLFSKLVTVSVGTSPDCLAFDGTHIWVANYSSNNVSKIDINSNTVIVTVPVGLNPSGLTFDGTYIWVCNRGGNSISKIDIGSNTVTATAIFM